MASRRSSMSSGGGPSSARRGPGLGDVMRRLFGDFAEDEDEDDGEDEQVNEGVKEAVEMVILKLMYDPPKGIDLGR